MFFMFVTNIKKKTRPQTETLVGVIEMFQNESQAKTL